MKLSILLNFLLLGFFVAYCVEAGGGSGSNESGGSGSHESHHKHKNNWNKHDRHHDHHDSSDSHHYHHHNQPAFIPQLARYPNYYDMPRYQHYGGYAPMYGQMPYYQGPNSQYPVPLLHGAPYPNFFYPGVGAPTQGFHPGVAYPGQAGPWSQPATGYYAGVGGVAYPGQAASLPPGYSGVSGFAYSGQGAALPPQVVPGNPSQASGSAAVLPPTLVVSGNAGPATQQYPGQSGAIPATNVPLAAVAQSSTDLTNTDGSNRLDGSINGGRSVSGISSSSLDHRLKVSKEYEEAGHKHSVNQY